MRYLVIALLAVFASAASLRAADSADEPRPIGLTRPEMKILIEDMKARKPRIPLPELTEEDKAKLGERSTSYESRLRYHYMPASGEGGGRGFGGGGASFGSSRDPNVTLDYAFKVQLFWIVCRVNNCQYCQGHQESKLLRAGQNEDEIAALDGDWSEFSPAERAAFAFARKLTYEPHRLTDADLDALRKHYKNLQILEMILSIAGNNSINRWKEGVGVPQNEGSGGLGRSRERAAEAPAPAEPAKAAEKHTYLTPTSEAYKSKITKVAPLVLDEKSGAPLRLAVSRRPALESRKDVELALERARKRAPRLPLVSDEEARKTVAEDFAEGSLPNWVRLLANFPVDGKGRVSGIRSADEKGDLSPLLKAQVSWIIARQDRAWYAAGQAQRRLKALGVSDDEIYQLDENWHEFSAKERALFTVAKKLAASPVVLTDKDVAEAVRVAGPRDVVQLVSFATNRASFDRITEAAGLPLEK